MNRLSRLDLPTPLSPISTTLKRKSSAHMSASATVLHWRPSLRSSLVAAAAQRVRPRREVSSLTFVGHVGRYVRLVCQDKIMCRSGAVSRKAEVTSVRRAGGLYRDTEDGARAAFVVV